MGLLRSYLKRALLPIKPFTMVVEEKFHQFNTRLSDGIVLTPTRHMFRDIRDIREATIAYVRRLRLTKNGQFVGYAFSSSASTPLLYCTLAALLLKHLYNAEDDGVEEELEQVLACQNEDGLFRDPEIACPAAETEDYWGWRHLTLHALMTLALFGKYARCELRYLARFRDKDFLVKYLKTLDWGYRAAWTSNEVQNVGVMLQYARDYHNDPRAPELLEIIYEMIAAKQDPDTGLHGEKFDTSDLLSIAVQASYHFFLLYAYDHRPIPRIERVIEKVLDTQNMLGGYSANWKSSACEDIDSIDILVRFGGQCQPYTERIGESLLRAVSTVLTNINSDGSWVFCRTAIPGVYPHQKMQCLPDDGNLFFTWFRTLGLAYCLIGLKEQCPQALRYDWRFGWAPGLQLAIVHPYISDKIAESDAPRRTVISGEGEITPWVS